MLNLLTIQRYRNYNLVHDDKQEIFIHTSIPRSTKSQRQPVVVNLGLQQQAVSPGQPVAADDLRTAGSIHDSDVFFFHYTASGLQRGSGLSVPGWFPDGL